MSRPSFHREPRFYVFRAYLRFLRTTLLRRELPRTVPRESARALLRDFERLAAALFGASTVALKLFEASTGADAFTALSEAGFMAALTLATVLPRPSARRDSVSLTALYTLYYLVSFFILFHYWQPETWRSPEPAGSLLAYLALIFSQAMRVGRLPGALFCAALIVHFLVSRVTVEGWDWLDTTTGVQEFFTVLWGTLFALFLETALYFSVIRYLELRSNREREQYDLELARRVHNSLFPTFSEDEHFRLYAFRSPENKTGGDFYDLIRLREGNTGVFVADVSGHGISSAMMTAALKVHLAKIPYRFRFRPSLLLDYLDDLVYEHYGSHHVSAVYIFLDFQSMHVSLANAGHPQALYCPKGELFRPVRTRGSVIGYRIQKPVAPEFFLPIQSGDRFFLYTDGLLEYQGAFEDSGDGPPEGEELLAGLEHLDGQDLIRAVLERVRTRPDFEGFQDDVMAVLLEVK